MRAVHGPFSFGFPPDTPLPCKVRPSANIFVHPHPFAPSCLFTPFRAPLPPLALPPAWSFRLLLLLLLVTGEVPNFPSLDLRSFISRIYHAVGKRSNRDRSRGIDRDVLVVEAGNRVTRIVEL